MTQAQATVHIVDDDEAFLKAVSRLLVARGFAVSTFNSARGFLASLSPASRGCALVDLQMPELSGLELQQALRSAPVGLPIVFLTGHGDIPSSVKAMRLGAEDFLEKRIPQEQLIDAVRRALERDERERAARTQNSTLRDRFAALTSREAQVLSQVVRGRLNKQIAADLGIHERTVKLHRTAITGKLQVDSVAELTRLYQDAGYFDAPVAHLP